MSRAELCTAVGTPEADVGSGIHIYVYRLRDAQVRVGVAGERLIYVDHATPSGRTRIVGLSPQAND